MSGGQIIGGIGGAIVGFFTPIGVVKGAMYGMQIGGYLDPPDGPTISGPRLGDLSVQTSTYGTVIPRTYGTITVLGNVFWLENNKLKETVHKKKSGGKGGGGETTTKSYTYSATFALGLCKGPIAGIRRIWIRNKLFYDAGSNDLTTIMASNAIVSNFSMHTGTDTQLPDSRMQATLGAANVPGYRGLAYIVFKDLELADYSNSLQALQIKVEVISISSPITLSGLIEAPYPTPYNHYSVAKPQFVGVDKARFLRIVMVTPGSFVGGYFELMDLYFNGTKKVYKIINRTPTTQDLPCFRSYDESVNAFDMFDVFDDGLFNTGRGQLVYNNNLYVGISGLNRAGNPIKQVFSRRFITGPIYKITVSVETFAIYTDGEYIWTVDSLATKKYNRELQLQATGPGYPIGAIGVSVLTHNGSSLVYCALTGNNKTISISDDLQTQVLLADDPDINTGTFYSETFAMFNNTMIFAACSYADPAKLKILYYNPSTPSGYDTLSSIVSTECLKAKQLAASDIDVTALTQTVRGFKLSAISAIRAGFEPLQACFPFDVYQQGYKIKFKPRGSLSVATIEAKDLGAIRD